MAYVDNNNLIDPDKQNQGAAQGQSNGQQLGGADSGIVTGGGGGSGTSQAGDGTGGQNGWTNIQNYIGANAGNTGSSKLLNDTVGSQFSNDRSQLDSQASQAQAQGDEQAKTIKDYADNASTKLSNLGNQYSYGADLTKQNSEYQDGVSGFKNAYNGSYTAPSSFSYGMTADSQNSGANLANDSGFSNMMGKLYNHAAGGQMGSGSQTLQNQLDVNNTSLNDTRSNLLSQYADLGSYGNKKISDTNNALASDAKQYGESQNKLKDYVNNAGNKANANIQNSEAQAKSDYSNTYNNGLSGNANAGYQDSQGLAARGAQYFDNSAEGNSAMKTIGDLQKAGLVNQNATWSQLQNEIGVENQNSTFAGVPGSKFAPQAASNLDALNNFYSQQNAQYANVGDSDKRQWNTLQNILNSGAAAKTQGFSVAPGSALQGTIIGGGKGGATRR